MDLESLNRKTDCEEGQEVEIADGILALSVSVILLVFCLCLFNADWSVYKASIQLSLNGTVQGIEPIAFNFTSWMVKVVILLLIVIPLSIVMGLKKVRQGFKIYKFGRILVMFSYLYTFLVLAFTLHCYHFINIMIDDGLFINI